MARGWESKSVEQQQAELASEQEQLRRSLSPRQKALNRKREGLLLTRTALLRQLKASPHAQHRSMLEESLAEIDKQLACFEGNADQSHT